MDYPRTVRKALDLLVEGLSPMAEQTLLEAFGPNSVRPLGHDPQALLSAILNNWEPTFASVLPSDARTLAFDLRASRNQVAHHSPISFDDAYRAVDSVDRLLRFGGQPVPEDLRRLKRELLTSTTAASAQAKVDSAPTPPPVDARSGVPYGTMGALWMAGPAGVDGLAFSGVVRCPQCKTQIRVIGKRLVNPLSERAPQFILWNEEKADVEVGHLSLAKIKTSPKLLYGAITHCKPESWISAFFNRNYLGGSDPHLVLAESKPVSRPADDEIPW